MLNKELKVEVVTAEHSFFKLNLKGIWSYRYLVVMFVKRDFVVQFKQTLLGYLWFFTSPILTTIVFVVIFGEIAKVSTDGLPKILFYLSGITLWNYFSNCFSRTSSVFTANKRLFGKVYFPRLVLPISFILSNLMRLGIQFLLFLLVWAYYFEQGEITPNLWILATPILVALLAALALGLGLIFTSITTKYRDIGKLTGFILRFLMYATPIVYPISSLSGIWKTFAGYNPMSSIFECFKYGWLGNGNFTIYTLGLDALIIFCLLITGVLIFNDVEKTFIDTV